MLFENSKIKLITYKICITGIVKSIGFRPFIWKIANNSGLKGAVSNITEGVIIKLNFEDRGKSN